MIRHTESQTGFTAVELLITLFIAAAFMMVGYQLYTVVIRDGANVRNRAKASSIAEDYIKRKTASIATCSSTTVTTNETPPSDSGLMDIAVSSVVSAPYGCGVVGEIVKIQVDVSYGPASQREEVSNVVFVAS